jgi:hypothetical protein
MSRDDQVMRSARSASPANVGDETGVVNRGGFAVREDLDRGHDHSQRSGAVRRPGSGVGQFDADAILRDGQCGNGEFVVVQCCAIDGPALVGDQDIGVEDQPAAHGSARSSVA